MLSLSLLVARTAGDGEGRMARVRRGFKARRRRNRILKAARGFRGGRSKLFRTAVEAVHRAWAYAYRDRKVKKREYRSLWIIRVNAACREEGIAYSRFMNGLKNANIAINRKLLAELAVSDPEGFRKLVETAKQAVSQPSIQPVSG